MGLETLQDLTGIKIAPYARISRDEDKKNFATIESQNEKIRDWINERNGTIVDYYFDDNITGYTLNRPEFSRLSDDLDSGKIDMVVAKDLSRIGRNNALVLLFLEELKNKNKRIVVIDDNYDSAIDDDDIIGIKTWYNERYIKDISKKIRSGIKTRQKKGENIAAVPYGYILHTKMKHTVLVNHECSDYVKLIFKLYIDGNGYNKIAGMLTTMGVPTPSMINKRMFEENGRVYKKPVSNAWNTKMVQLIIKNDFYIGTLRQGKFEARTLHGKPERVDEENQYIFFNHHEPIISKDKFLMAQDMANRRTATNYRGEPKHNNLYTGFLVCADCGKGLVALNKEGKHKSYICGTYNKRGKDHCSTHYVLDYKITARIKEHLKLIRERLHDEILTYNNDVQTKIKTNDNFASSIKQAKKELQQANDLLKITLQQKIKDMIKYQNNSEMIESQYEIMEKEQQQKISILSEQLEEMIKMKELSNEFENNSKTALQIFDDIINKEQIEKRDLEFIIDKIIVYQGGDCDIMLKGNIDELLNNGEERSNFNEDEKNHCCVTRGWLLPNDGSFVNVVFIVNWIVDKTNNTKKGVA